MNKPKLVPNWKEVWKHISTQAMTMAGFIQVTWMSLPSNWQASIDNKYISIITIVCLVIGVIGKYTQQPSLNK